MRWPLRLLRSVPRALALPFLLGLAAYAYSPEGRCLLGDLQKW